MPSRPKMKTIQNEINTMKNAMCKHEERLKSLEEMEFVNKIQEVNMLN